MVMEGASLDEQTRDWEQFHRFLVVASVRTGNLLCPFERMHAYVEELAGRPVLTHEMGDQAFADELAEKSKPEFERLFYRLWPSESVKKALRDVRASTSKEVRG